MNTPVPIWVVSNEEAEQADYVVCAPAEWETPFADNEAGVCGDCGRAIQFRPHVPKRPPKICVQCCFDRDIGGHA